MHHCNLLSPRPHLGREVLINVLQRQTHLWCVMLNEILRHQKYITLAGSPFSPQSGLRVDEKHVIREMTLDLTKAFSSSF